MRICLVSTGDFHRDSRARTLARSLRRSGHEVLVVTGGAGPDSEVDGVAVRHVATRYPHGWGVAGKVLRRLQPRAVRERVYLAALARAARDTDATLFYATSPRAIPAAVRAAGDQGAVVRDPRHPHAGPRDLVVLAPGHPELSVSPGGAGASHHTPSDRRGPSDPHPSRHAGRRIALCYRKTDSNPGRYLESALRRAGIDVDLHTETLDWDELDRATSAVVFVEGPYPALRLSGTNPGVPVVFWAHHGEHHLMANLRLTERYGAHAVLLAHSWHLAHRFPVPVHRFPFGYPVELMDASTPFEDRRYDVAMVGGQLRREGGVYERRQQLVRDIEAVWPLDEVAFESNVTADRMAELYGDARIVLNEGGTRHYPITMRVFEAVGAGALLVTDDLPGTELLFARGEHYVVLEDDVVAQVRRLLAVPGAAAAIARRGHQHARDHHTYDHRVDELIAILDGIDPSSRRSLERPERDALASVVDEDVEVQRLAQFGAADLQAMVPTREVWDGHTSLDRLRPGSMEAVVIATSTPHLLTALRSARRYVYATTAHDEIAAWAEEEQPQAMLEHHGDVLRVDLMAESYRVAVTPARPQDRPLD